MRNKVKSKALCALLSVCLFAGLAVPAFAIAAGSSSSQYGDPDKVTQLAFQKTSYDIGKGVTKELANELVAYVGNNALADPNSLNYEWTVDKGDIFTIDSNGDITADEGTGSGTVTVKIADKNVKATVKVNAKGEGSGKATGYKFEKGSYNVPVGKNATAYDKIVILPVPESTVFTSDQQSAISTAVKMDIPINGISPSTEETPEKVTLTYPSSPTRLRIPANVGGKNIQVIGVPAGVTVTFVGKVGNATCSNRAQINGAGTSAITIEMFGGIGVNGSVPIESINTALRGVSSAIRVSGTTIPVSATGFAAVTVTQSGVSGLASIEAQTAQRYNLAVDFPRYDNSSSTTLERVVTFTLPEAVPSTKVSATQTTINLEVGKQVDVRDYFKQGPSGTNVTAAVEYYTDFTSETADADDYAIIDDNHKLLGVAVGKVRAVASIETPDGAKTAYFTVNVVPKGKGTGDTGSSQQPADGTAPTLSFSAGNTSLGGAGFTITLKNVPEGSAVSYKSLNTAIAKVDAVGKVTPVGAGSTQVEVTVEGFANKLYCTVNVKAASTSNPNGGGITDVPQTGVAVLAPLF